jgi:hypothetical protein
MTQNFDRFQTEFAKEAFHLFFDYPAFWIFCYKVGDMAINYWEHCIGVDNPLSLEADERWQYIEDFMDYAQRGDKEAQQLLTMFASCLEKGLRQEGGRSALDKAEKLSGMKCEKF